MRAPVPLCHAPLCDALLHPLCCVQDNDSPGMFVFVREIIKVQESDGVAVVQVQRAKGRSGEVSLKYKTLSGSAVADKDFTPVEGTLTWPHAEAGVRDIEVPIARTTNWESVEYFEVEIGEASGGACCDESRTRTLLASRAPPVAQELDASRLAAVTLMRSATATACARSRA